MSADIEPGALEPACDCPNDGELCPHCGRTTELLSDARTHKQHIDRCHNSGETCRRGHPRSPEATRVRRLVRKGRESLIHECRECVKVARELRKAKP